MVKNHAPDVPLHLDFGPGPFALVPAAAADLLEDDLNTMVDALTYDSSGSNVPRVFRNSLGYPNPHTYSDVSTATNLPVTGNGFFSSSNVRPSSSFASLSVAYPPPPTPTSFDRHLFLSGHHNVNTYRSLNQPEFGASPYRGRRTTSRMNVIGSNNVVNVFRIQHGQDVRTTVSFSSSCIRAKAMLTHSIDHAPQYSQQDASGNFIPIDSSDCLLMDWIV